MRLRRFRSPVSLPLLILVAACASCDEAPRYSLSVGSELPICVPVPAELMPGGASASRANAEPYYITVGTAELEATAPRDDGGRSDNNYVGIRRDDPVIEDRIRSVVAARMRAERELELERLERGEGTDGQGVSPPSESTLEALRREVDGLADEENELRQMVSGETPTVARLEDQVSFGDWPMPFRIYEGDTIEVKLTERDSFADDLLGHTYFVVDAEMLESGYLSLSTGWVQALALGFVRCPVRAGST